MSVHRTSLKYKLSYVLISVIFILAIGISAFFSQISKHIDDVSEYKGKEIANDVINKSVEQLLGDFLDAQFITVNRDENGNITSVETNTENVNQAQNEISIRINEELKNIERNSTKIPVGTLSGITYLSGRGFNVNLKLHQMGAVDTEMKSEFISAGINQTKYRLYIDIKVDIKAILPAHSNEISLQTQYLVCETVIVGEVPKMYLCK